MTDQARFPNHPSSIPAARRLVDGALASAEPTVRDRALLMVSELATNAVKHAGSGFTVTVSQTAAAIRVDVRDSGNGRPTRRNPLPTDPTGRGLLIVQAMSREWGIDDHPEGKTVWFTVDATISEDAR